MNSASAASGSFAWTSSRSSRTHPRIGKTGWRLRSRPPNAERRHHTVYWQEEDDKVHPPQVPDEVVDVNFKVACRALPLDHAHALSEAVLAVLPWLHDEPLAAVHLIHGAESGNGWLRPEDPDALLYPSRRTRFTLRVPRHRVAQVQELAGHTLDVGGYPLTLREPHVRELSPLTTVFSRHVVSDQEHEAAFLDAMAAQLREGLDIRVRKMVAGRAHHHRFP
ncbi:MAG TPA: hypothetical protein ENK62_00370, partial [Chromatiales bacterium]|nr:hypothetical protein [Chromatiales bacterium]